MTTLAIVRCLQTNGILAALLAIGMGSAACFSPSPDVACGVDGSCPPGYSCEPAGSSGVCGSDDWSEPDDAGFIADHIYNIDTVATDDGLLVLGTSNRRIRIFHVGENQVSEVGEQTSVAGDNISGLGAALVSVGGEQRLAVVALEEHGGLRFCLFDLSGALIVDMAMVTPSGDLSLPLTIDVASLRLQVYSPGAPMSDAGPHLAVLWQETVNGQSSLHFCAIAATTDPVVAHGDCPATLATDISPHSGAMAAYSSESAVITFTGSDDSTNAVTCGDGPPCGESDERGPPIGYSDLQIAGDGTFIWTGIDTSDNTGVVGWSASDSPLQTQRFDEQSNFGAFVVDADLGLDGSSLGFVYSIRRESGIRDLYFRCARSDSDRVLELAAPTRVTRAANHDSVLPRVKWSSHLDRFVAVFTDQRGGGDSDGVFYSLLPACP